MTPEEKLQVQNIINAKTRLLSEQVSQLKEDINSLTSQLSQKDNQISELNSQLADSLAKNSALQDELHALKSKPLQVTQLLPPPQPAPKPEPQKPAKPSYIVSLLRRHFPADNFMPGQEELVDAILAGRDVFASMPEHYAPDICYKLPALLLPGLTLIISPDEPDASNPQPHTETLTSSDTPAKKRELLRSLKSGSAKILCSTLELLSSDKITKALQGVDVSMAVILDTENLRKASEFVDSLSAKRIARGVFTSSTTPAQRQEILKYLRSPLKVITGFNNPESSFTVIRTENKSDALRDALSSRQGVKAAVFCSSPEAVFRLKASGFNSDSLYIVPSRLYRDFNITDAKLVIHFDAPSDLAAYANEITRADTKSECIMLLSRNDLRNSDKSLSQFANAKDHKAFLLAYLGQDDVIVPEAPAVEAPSQEITDFDFGSSNEAQKEAITSTEGPLLIIAGPGTGKTYTLIQRAVFLIQKKHVSPSSIMLATFTDKAAQELNVRIIEELNARKITADTGSMYTGTFHVICSRILKEYPDFTQHGKNFTILDDFGHAYLILQNFKLFENIDGINEVFRTSGKWKRSQELRDYINALSEELIDPEELIRDDNPQISALGQAVKIHDDLLAANHSASYSALLVLTYKLLRDNPEILADVQRRIQYIMIDEYQDTNFVQEQLVFLLGSKDGNICVVGDDDQSLYRFRGATVRNILEFPDKWGKSGCKTVKLMLNYRSTPAIVKFASDWMTDTADFFTWENFRYSKRLEAYRPDVNYPSVIRLAGINDKDAWHEKILTFLRSLKADGIISDYSQTAFLFRSVRNKNVQELAVFLESNNINVYSPRSNLFFKRPEVHFTIGCMISMFPDYVSDLESGAFSYQGKEPEYITYYRDCLHMVSRFIDKPSYAELKRFLMQKRAHHSKLKGYTGYVYSDLIYQLFAFEPFKRALNADLRGNAKDLRQARNFSKLVQVFIDYEKSYRVNNIKGEYMSNQFRMMMNIYVKFRIEEGLDEYESEDTDIPAGHTAFMTIHQAKGKEFPIVFVDSLWSKPESELRHDRNNSVMSDIMAAHSRRPEYEPQERIKFFDFWRMYYTAFTRARNLLILTCNEDGKTPSRYLEGVYNKLDDADEALSLSEIERLPESSQTSRNVYSFTQDILIYESCPRQYKFFKELEFPDDVSQSTFLGNLVHATIENVHHAVLNHEEFNSDKIAEWFADNYDKLSRSQLAYLSEATRENALRQVMHYVNLQGNDWSGVSMAEAEASITRSDYILKGKIDLVRTRECISEIIDFKTGSRPNINVARDRERLENNRRQVNIYAYIAARSLGLNVAGMKLYYTGDESSSPEIAYRYDENGAEEIMKGIDETVSRIEARDFEHLTDDRETCRHCPFRFYCGRE